MPSKPLLVVYFPLLKAIAKIRGKKNKRLVLKQLSRDAGFADCLREISMNIMDQSIPIDAAAKKKINKHSTVVRNLAKRKQIEQSGGFLNIAIPLLSMVVAGLIKDAKD